MQQLLSEAPTLSSKIETLRLHLEERLGGCAALQRVYDYCCREENGVQVRSTQVCKHASVACNVQDVARDTLLLTLTYYFRSVESK